MDMNKFICNGFNFECSTVFGCLILCTVIILNFMQITISAFFSDIIEFDGILSLVKINKKSSKICIIFFSTNIIKINSPQLVLLSEWVRHLLVKWQLSRLRRKLMN